MRCCELVRMPKGEVVGLPKKKAGNCSGDTITQVKADLAAVSRN